MKTKTSEINTIKANKNLLDIKDRDLYLKLEAIPYQKNTNNIIIATARVTQELIDWTSNKYGQCEFIIIPFALIVKVIREAFIQQDIQRATSHLSTIMPKKSAINIKISPIIIIATIIISLIISDNNCYLMIISHILCSLAILFKMILFLIGYLDALFKKNPIINISNIEEEELPVYTILIALFKESEVVEDLVNAIRRLNYPKSKLDVKIILEEEDNDTILAISKLNCETYFDIMILPNCQPKTKAKALNYALLYARGEYVVVYDAEDEPDADQLKKSYLIFKNSTSKVSCLQAKLTCHNDMQTFISRMFSLEYVILFEFILKALELLKAPILLGGSSNHFVKEKLLSAGAWDPYNVTEDADLGLRIYSLGFESKLIQSNTKEEATTRLPIWINQRSRWIKGYLISFLVHLKNRNDLKYSIGNLSTIIIEFFILSNSAIFFLNFFNIISLIFILYCKSNSKILSLICTINLYLIFLIPMIMSLLTMLYQKKKSIDIFLSSIIFPFYLMFHNLAALKAIGQLFINPFYWEKTPHGFSKKIIKS